MEVLQNNVLKRDGEIRPVVLRRSAVFPARFVRGEDANLSRSPSGLRSAMRAELLAVRMERDLAIKNTL